MSDAELSHAAVEEAFSDYYEQGLPPGRAAAIEAHLDACERCREEYRRFCEAVDALSGLHKATAPGDFDEKVAGTIHRRSGGLFFGRRGVGDRVPFRLLGLLALLALLALLLLTRFSSTGTVHEPLRKERAPEVAPGADEVLPRP
jgi:anti-sigma factor RsiW